MYQLCLTMSSLWTALGIQEIKASNDVTTEDDEEDKHEILLDAGSLSPTEENALHSDISS